MRYFGKSLVPYSGFNHKSAFMPAISKTASYYIRAQLKFLLLWANNYLLVDLLSDGFVFIATHAKPLA